MHRRLATQRPASTNSNLAALLSQSAASTLPTSVTSSGPPQASNSGNAGNGNSTPPSRVISINGANPATITIGTAYADLGATITAPLADLNLGLTVVVDNATSTDGTVQIDTSKPGTHTILYTVTDPSGLTGSATRTVIVSAPQQSPAPANDSAATSPAANENVTPSTNAAPVSQRSVEHLTVYRNTMINFTYLRQVNLYSNCLRLAFWGTLGMILFGSGATAQAAPYDPAYLIVSGNPSPDSTGIYAPIGDYNGDTLYARQSDSAFDIWRSEVALYTSKWTVSAVPPTGSWTNSPWWTLDYFHIPQGNSNGLGGGASVNRNHFRLMISIIPVVRLYCSRSRHPRRRRSILHGFCHK